MTSSDDGVPARPGTAGPWTSWTVLRRGPVTADADLPDVDRPTLAQAVAELPAGVHVRGFYDVSGMRAEGDVMLWLHGDDAALLQTTLRTLRQTAELVGTERAWEAMGVHRPAEFSASHEPAYMRDTTPAAWLTVYPFVRSYEWYLLPVAERQAMLAEHGREGRTFPQVLSNTVAAFALGDYEWLLGLEAEDLTDLVDLMRHLRATEARRHVRVETPFWTGRRIAARDVAEVLR